ncbi:MAG: hypothetical protein MUO70_08100 [Euryarchaeota archaeon]|nr:hypothetical protein [Euryarchaeota archaeon]
MTEARVPSGKSDEGGAEKALEFFCRHLVALCVTYRQVKSGIPIEKQRFFAYPGVVICIRGFCSFLTAGHALKDLSTRLERGEISVESVVLADTFGPGTISEKPIPFDLLNEPRFFIDNEEEGLDFGLIALRPYYVALLARHGIKALFEENWIDQHRVQFDAYTMLGLPEEFVTCEQDGPAGDSGVVGKVSPTMIGVKAIDSVPEGTKPTTYPRFIGQLNENLPLSSIRGMSGGPIFGFRYGPSMAYWVVAIQSSWLPSRRIVFGCPLPVLAELLTTWIDDLSKSGEFRSVN